MQSVSPTTGTLRARLPLPALLRAMRPKQYLKNGIVFTALVFSVRQAWRPAYPDTWLPLLLRALVAFLAFCAIASAERLGRTARRRCAERGSGAVRGRTADRRRTRLALPGRAGRLRRADAGVFVHP